MSAQHSIPITKEAIPTQTETAVSEVAIPQYGLRAIFAVWAAAALPMAALAWLVAPALKDQFAGTGNIPFFKALNVCLTVGLVWQFVLVASLVCSARCSGSARRGAHARAVPAARSG